MLNNTPAVCRTAYIDPRVFDRFDSGETVYRALGQIKANAGPHEWPDRERIERAVLRLLAAERGACIGRSGVRGWSTRTTGGCRCP